MSQKIKSNQEEETTENEFSEFSEADQKAKVAFRVRIRCQGQKRIKKRNFRKTNQHGKEPTNCNEKEQQLC